MHASSHVGIDNDYRAPARSEVHVSTMSMNEAR